MGFIPRNGWSVATFRLRVSFAELYRAIMSGWKRENLTGNGRSPLLDVEGKWKELLQVYPHNGERHEHHGTYSTPYFGRALSRITHTSHFPRIDSRTHRTTITHFRPKGRLAIGTITLAAARSSDVTYNCMRNSTEGRARSMTFQIYSQRDVAQFFSNEGNLLTVDEIYLEKRKKKTRSSLSGRWAKSVERVGGAGCWGRHLGAGIFRHHLAETAMRGPAKHVSFCLHSLRLANLTGSALEREIRSPPRRLFQERRYVPRTGISQDRRRDVSHAEPKLSSTSLETTTSPSRDERLAFDEYIPGSVADDDELTAARELRVK